MILETIEILDSNLTLTLEQLQTKVTNGDYDDLLSNYNLLIMISNGLVLINKDDKSCKIIAPTDLDNYVKFTDYATFDTYGIVKIGSGLQRLSSGALAVSPAGNNAIAARSTNVMQPIIPGNLNIAVKAALSDEKRISDMTDSEKANARGVIGAINKDDLTEYVKNTDYATSTKTGVVKYNTTFGIAVNTEGGMYIISATENDINLRTSTRKPIVPSNLDYAVRSVYPITQTSITEPIAVNTIYNLGLQTSLDIILPSGQVGDFIQFDFISKDIATTLSITSTNGLIGYDLIPEVNKIYSLYFDWGVIGYDGTDMTYGWRFNYSEYELNSI